MSTPHPESSSVPSGSPVVADMSMSLDGFVAALDHDVSRVFTWYGKEQPPRRSPAGDGESPGLGVIVYGRRTFEAAQGWGGEHPMGVPVIVVSHTVPDGWPRGTVSFNTDGIDDAIDEARSLAAGRIIALGSPTIIQQCLDRGLVDRVQVSLVPVLLGGGIRLFESLQAAPVELGDPIVSEGNGVTHLAYSVLSGAGNTR